MKRGVWGQGEKILGDSVQKSDLGISAASGFVWLVEDGFHAGEGGKERLNGRLLFMYSLFFFSLSLSQIPKGKMFLFFSAANTGFMLGIKSSRPSLPALK